MGHHRERGEKYIPIAVDFIDLGRTTLHSIVGVPVLGGDADGQVAQAAFLGHARAVIVVKVPAAGQALLFARILDEASRIDLYRRIQSILLTITGPVTEGIDGV